MSKPRILFLCTASPMGTIGGSGIRTLHVARLLERIGPVTMVAATDHAWTQEQVAETKSAFNLAAYFEFEETPARGLDQVRKTFDPRFLNTNGVAAKTADADHVAQLVRTHDVVWIHTLKLANAFRRFHWPHSVIDVDDIPSRYHAMAAPLAPTLKARLQRRRNAWICRRQEQQLFNRFSVLTVCKESDRAHFNWDPRARVVPNGFAVPANMPPPKLDPITPRLGMIGDFGHLPNSDGAAWFITHVLPDLQSKVPHLQIRLMGKKSVEIAARHQNSAVVGLGYVPDTGAEIATWSAMIVPTRQGGGTHLKVAEGLARRVPIVTTTHGARGYQLENETHVLMADTAENFVAACSRLLLEPNTGQALAQAGWDLFCRSYSWDSIGPAVADTVAAAVADTPPPNVA